MQYFWEWLSSTIVVTVRIEDDGLSFHFILFYFILFYFPFIFSYFFIEEYKMKKTKCDTVTGHMIQSQKSHAHVIWENNVEGSRKIMS